MIELNEVTKVYNQGRANEVAAIRGVSLTIKAREVTVLKGPSGSGKTTLLTLIGCLARPTSGRVRLRGEAVSSLPEKFLAELRRRTFGFVFQQHNLIRGVSALQNVMLPAYPLGLPMRALASTALELLAQLGLEHRAGLTAEHLSGGEAQRVAIARALINDPGGHRRRRADRQPRHRLDAAVPRYRRALQERGQNRADDQPRSAHLAGAAGRHRHNAGGRAGGGGVIFHPPILALTLVSLLSAAAADVGQHVRGRAAAALGPGQRGGNAGAPGTSDLSCLHGDGAGDDRRAGLACAVRVQRRPHGGDVRGRHVRGGHAERQRLRLPRAYRQARRVLRRRAFGSPSITRTARAAIIR